MSEASWYPLLVMSPFIGLAAYCLSQVMAARSGRWKSPYSSLALGAFVGCALTVLVAAIAIHGMRSQGLDVVGYASISVATYLALAFGYFNFVNLTVASLRIRLLEEILAAGRPVSRSRLLALYNSASVSAIRLLRLVQGGHLVEKDGRLFVGKARFLVVARIFDVLRWFILG